MSIDLGINEVKLDPTSMIVTETNEKGIIQYASKDFCKISGFSKEELIGQPHNMIRHNFMPKAAFADLWSTIQSGKKWVGIVINRTKDGGYYWVKAIVFPSKYVDGSTKYISVRVMPSQKEIDAVLELYPTMD
ncbi:PAS domain-containing protein [Arcobacter sp. LA11]|uniref:PAS domain-containing protein n=1 Tax=Arcobacter sp. LA11 TaxID=1898176 RepID=UPI000933212D|nr:PAS domain-containing protein [Arcobacter sp. LA11]